MIRVGQDGKGREVYTTGIRNSVGHDFHPETGELWFTDNQVDGMGDDIPPGEINRQTAAGQAFGHPWYGGGDVRTNEYKDETPPEGLICPVVEMDAHAADLGMTFYTGSMFPDEYRNAIFSAQHGSWNRTVPVGARVMVTKIAEDGTATSEALRRGLAQRRDRRVLGPPGRRRAASRRVDPRLRRPRRRDLPHLVRGARRLMGRALGLGLGGLLLAGATLAQDVEAGRKVANMCRTCHGLDGIAVMPVAPNIGGEPAAYLAAQLDAFKSGAREQEMMTVVARGLSDATDRRRRRLVRGAEGDGDPAGGLRRRGGARGLRRLPRRRRHRGGPRRAEPRRGEHHLSRHPAQGLPLGQARQRRHGPDRRRPRRRRDPRGSGVVRQDRGRAGHALSPVHRMVDEIVRTL